MCIRLPSECSSTANCDCFQLKYRVQHTDMVVSYSLEMNSSSHESSHKQRYSRKICMLFNREGVGPGISLLTGEVKTILLVAS